LACPVLVKASKIYVSFKPTRIVEALVACGGKVVYAGRYDDAKRIAYSLAEAYACGKPRVMDYEGFTIVPGFVDAHMHLRGLGVKIYGIDLSDVGSIEEFKAKLAREASRFSSWIIGRGWDQERMGAWPTRFDVDEAVGDRPAVLMRVCGHAAVLSTAAMRLLGLLEDRENPEIDRGCNGEPTGIVYESTAAKAYEEAVKNLDQLKLVLEASRHVLANGITMVGNMDVGAEEFTSLVRAWNAGLLRLRVRVYLSRRLYEAMLKMGFTPFFGDEMLRVKGVKMYMDGSLGARTAWLREPYSDAGGTGSPQASWRDVARLASAISQAGGDLAVHAIGDAALEEVLKGFEAAGCRCRVEHASLAPPDLIEKMSRLGVRAAVQPRFLVSDFWAVDRLGRRRVRWLYPFKTMLVSGVSIGFSSDAPVEPVNPLEGVRAAVTRGSLAEYTKDERLDIETALYLYTRGSAAVLGERWAGCLEPGCYADMTVLSADPLEVDVESLPSQVRFEATLVGGELVWSRG
jgi:predicted amidohydrolase YtcJ